MAHAIHHEWTDLDDRRAPDAGNLRALAQGPRRPRAAGPRPADARGWGVVHRRHGHHRVEFRHRREMESALRARSAGRSVGPPSRIETPHPHAADGGADSELDPQTATA